MDYLSDWKFVVAASLASFIVGLSRGGFAGGIAFSGVLILTLAVPPTVAAAFMLPILCFVDPFGCFVYRKHVNWDCAKILIPGGLVGIGIGTAIFFIINENIMRTMVAVLAFYIIADRLYNYYRNNQDVKTYPKPIGYLLGVITGVTTMIIHAGHPSASAYMLRLRLPRMQFLGTFAIMFTIFNYVKLVPYAVIGILDWSLISVAVYFLPVTVIGFFIGKVVAKKMSDAVFYQVMYVSIFIMGIKIGYDGLIGILAS